MTELKKYRVVYRPEGVDVDDPLGSFLQKINALADVGYRVHTFDHDYALMSFQENQYAGVTNLRDAIPAEVDRYLSLGWEIASASISTKFVRMVKRSN